MKPQHTPGRAIRKTLSALALAAAPAGLWAQVSLYQYSESVETYTDITAADGGYSLGVPTWWPPVNNQRAFVDPNILEGTLTNGYLNPAIGPGFPIGFNLTFNGDVFDRVGISNSGFITFGKSSDGNQAVWTYSITHSHGRPFVQYVGGPSVPYKRNRVAGFANGSLYMQDMSPTDPPGPITSLRIATIGTAPNRVCVIQFKDFLMAYPPSSSRANFQIRLNESDNSVEVRYGEMIMVGGSVQVGLGGRIPEDFNSRMTAYEQPAFLYDWNTTVAGTVNTSACTTGAEEVGHPNGSCVPPVVGRTFKWTPDACPPPAWPLTIGDLSFDYALVQWGATAAGNYEYFVTDTNDVNGPEVTSGTTTDPEAYLFGLEPATTYYIFVRSICGGEPGAWPLATSFATYGGGIVVCDGGVVTENYCSHQFDVVRWLYSSADGSMLRIELDSGFVGNAGAESFKIWDGTDTLGTPLQPVGDIHGYSLNAASGNILIQLRTDAGACEAQPWYLPLQWRVGCKNCTDPLVNYAIGTVDCDNQEYYVDVNVFNLGSSTTLVMENSLGLTPTVVSSTGVHAIGPFPSGDPVEITAQNPDNLMCYSTSAVLVNEPCAVLDCGPTVYEKCTSAGEVREWLLQGDGQAMSVRFLPGYMGWDANVWVYDGADDSAPGTLVSSSGQTNNQVVTSTNAQNMLLVRYQATTYNDYACSLGNTLPFKFVAECAASCIQPTATFASNCLTSAQYQVVATITAIGSSGSVTITNNAGAAPVVASAPGDYTVGPFASGTSVTLEVEGANEVCTWTSNPLTKDCSTIGITEAAMQQIGLFPNPNNGSFSIDLPVGMGGTIELQVFEPTGRRVAELQLNGNGRLPVDLGSLPIGFYSMVIHSNGQVASQRFSVIR